MAVKSLNEHVGHAERLVSALQKVAQSAGHLADTLAGPLPEEAAVNSMTFAPSGPGLIGDLGANLEAMERECLRVASGLNRIDEAVKPQMPRNAVKGEF